MNRAGLEELLAKCEAATEGSRELDAAIVAVVTGGRVAGGQDVFPGMYWTRGNSCQSAPPITSSLDAIVRLIEQELPGWMWVREHSDGHTYVRLLGPEYVRHEFMGSRNSHSVSPSRGADGNVPLALCAAFIRARLAILDDQK